MVVGLPVPKQIVFLAHPLNRAMIIAPIIGRFFLTPDPNIAVGVERSAKCKSPIRKITDRVSQFVAQKGGVDEVVLAVKLAHGAGLIEFVSLKARPRGVLDSRDQRLYRAYRPHIVRQFQHLIACAVQGNAIHLFNDTDQPRIVGRESGIEPDLSIIVVENAGVKGRLSGEGTVFGAVLMADIAVKLILPCGSIAHGDADPRRPGGAVVEVVSAVIAPANIRRPQLFGKAAALGVLLFPVDHALAPPV